VWGENEAAQLALGGPRGDLSLVGRQILMHQKVAINTVHIWLTNLSTPVLPQDSEAFKLLSHTIQQLLLDTKDKRVFARKLVPSGKHSAQRLMDNLHGYIILDTHSFEEKAIRWYGDLLLGNDQVNNMNLTNGIMMAYGMCPPCTLQEYYKIDPKLEAPTHFMQGTAEEIW
jgi:hypothetical protein